MLMRRHHMCSVRLRSFVCVVVASFCRPRRRVSSTQHVVVPCHYRPRVRLKTSSLTVIEMRLTNFADRTKGFVLRANAGVQICMKSLLVKSSKLSLVKIARNENLVLQAAQTVRHTSFFNKLTADQLWKGVTSVSNPGRKRGRGGGKDRKGKKNLNIGQRIGIGKEYVNWPGLNAPLHEDGALNVIEKLDAPSEKVARRLPTERRLLKTKKFSSPLERGWSGGKRAGKKMGTPDPVEEYEGFESVILDIKLKSMLTSILGRKRFFNVLVATGNGNGLIGFGRCVGGEANACLKLARNRAAKKLVHIDQIHRDSVNHNFVSVYGRTRVYVEKRPPGYGLICHRAIKAICQLIGIKNLYAKVEGPSNLKHLIRAFIVGLLRQKSFQEIADETKLHLVEFQKERFDYPEVLASPAKCLSSAEARKKNINLEQVLLGGIWYKKVKKPPFFTKLPSYKTHLKRTLFKRNHDQVKINLLVEYGKYRSYLYDLYPECCLVTGRTPKPKEEDAVSNE